MSEKPTPAQLWALYVELGSVHKVAAAAGTSHSIVHRTLKKAGYTLKGEKFSADEDQTIRTYYTSTPEADFDLNALVALLPKRQYEGARQNICRRARDMGLTDQKRPPSAKARAGTSEGRKRYLQEHEHPRGFLGGTHSEETRARIGEKSKETWAGLTEDQKADQNLRALKTRYARGTLVTPRQNVTWQSGWHEIGGQRIYFRSHWEVNYAHYLEWLKGLGQIQGWAFEAEVFWFEAVKRGVRSYLPDFQVTENDGRVVYHEIKGWMDDRSATKLKRMAKYHPDVKLIVVDAEAYKALARKAKALVPGWTTLPKAK